TRSAWTTWMQPLAASMLFSTAVGSPTHAPFKSAFVKADPNANSTFPRQALSAVASGLAAFFDWQLSFPDSFLEAAFSFELAHLRSGSPPAVARCGAATSPAPSDQTQHPAFI